MRFTTPTITSMVIASAAMMPDSTEARSGLLIPRGYQYSRPGGPSSNAFALMSDILAAPFFNTDVDHLPSQMNSMMRQLTTAARESSLTNSPPFEVYHNEETNTVELTMEVPGVTSKNLSVELENENVLKIQGTRHGRRNGEPYTSNFEQMFQLDSDVDPSTIKVTLSAGILRVEARKVKKLESLKIDVLDVSAEDEDVPAEQIAGEEKEDEDIEDLDKVTEE